MPSETKSTARRALAALLLSGMLACGPVAAFVEEISGPEDQRVTKTCKRVAQCGGVVKSGDVQDEGTCENDLLDMIGDGRVSEERAVACAACLASNDDCKDILDNRHCDTACENVSYVENMFTSACTRSTLCRNVLSACAGAELASAEACTDPNADTCKLPTCSVCERALKSMLKDSPELDRELATCAECIERASPDAGPMGAPLCETVIARCQNTCAPIPEIAVRLEGAASALGLCAAREACGAQTDCEDELLGRLAEGGVGSIDGTMLDCESCLRTIPCDSPTGFADCAPRCADFDLDL